MNTYLRPCLTLFGLLTLLTGIVYPLAVTGIGQALFHYQANGSIVERDGKAVGSELIGQPFDDDKEAGRMRYFWGRPSATDPVPYTSFNADTSTGSNGSNLGPTNESFIAKSVSADGEDKPGAVQARVDALREAHKPYHDESEPVPVDLVTASGSGLDPHISPAAAEYQVGRVAKARGWSEQRVRDIVRAHTEGRTFGILGEPRVNVLLLNLALDADR